jgi:hypothetical protein
MTSHIYVLAHKDQPRFKIGKANDILNRARTLGLSDIDFARSFGLRVASEREAHRIERTLHRVFDRWRLPTQPGSRGGATEWFADTCRERLEAFIESNQDLLGFTQVDLTSLLEAEAAAAESALAARLSAPAERTGLKVRLNDLVELTEIQRRQLIDAESLFDALEAAREEAGRTHRDVGPETAHAPAELLARGAVLEARLKDLNAQADIVKRLNRALKVGRAPEVLLNILAILAKSRLSQHYVVVGTSALYAYESAAGVRFPYTLERLNGGAKFVQVKPHEGPSLLDLLHGADRSFERHPTDRRSAVNNKFYFVNVTEWRDEFRMASMDVIGAPKFHQVVVSTAGSMARMTTLHPMAFVRFKRELANAPTRTPNDAWLDAAEADSVETLVQQYLPQLAKEPIDPPLQQASPSQAPDSLHAEAAPPVAKLARKRKP